MAELDAKKAVYRIIQVEYILMIVRYWCTCWPNTGR